MSGATFVLLSFEGPDPYSRAGGLGTRVGELSSSLAGMGYETHLFFIGDPALPGYEVRQGGYLHLHRWCQWISRYHPNGVYDGEEGKWRDWNTSLPAWLVADTIGHAVAEGRPVIVLGEEWHTAACMVALRGMIDQAGWDGHVQLAWNANNTFGFDRIDWEALQRAAIVTTISRYMRTLLAMRGVEARVVPNGLSAAWLVRSADARCPLAGDLFRDRVVLTKVARWDPDKNWEATVTAVGALKRLGLRPLLVARGGIEPYGQYVLERAEQQGLKVRHVNWSKPGVVPLVEALRAGGYADLFALDSPLSQEQAKFLYSGSFAVLANSAIEPFGLVGLETMASGGLAFVGCTGEDYATNGYDACCVQSKDPWELVRHISRLLDAPAKAAAMRRAARATAAHFTWDMVIQRVLIPSLGLPLPIAS